MTKRWALGALSTLGVLFGLVGPSCSKDDASETPATGTARYRGSLVGDGELAGVVTLDLSPSTATPQSLATKATGSQKISGSVTVNVPGVGPIAIEGTINLDGGNATFQGSAAGGLVKFQGRLVDGVLSGTFESPWGGGHFSVAQEGVAGLKVYCGRFTAGARGRVHLFTLGDRGGGLFAAEKSGVFVGTFKENKLGFTLTPSGKGEAQLAGTSFSGSFSSDAPLPSATFSASEGECAALAPRPSGGDDAGVDASTDAGPTDATPTDGGGGTDPLLLHESSMGSDQLSFPVRHNASLFVATTGAAGYRILEIAIDGSKTTTYATLAGGDMPTGLATDSKNLYWLIRGAVGSKNGRVDYKSVLGAPTASTAISMLDMPTALVTDGTDLWTNGGDGKIHRFGAGGSLGSVTMGPTNDLATDGAFLYWAMSTAAPVTRASKDWTGPKEILTNADLGTTGTVRNLAVNGADLFAIAHASDFSKYVILRKAKDGTGAVTTMATFPGGGNAPFGLAVDATHVYFGGSCAAGPNQGCVRRLPRTASGGTPETLASALQSYIRDITVDDKYVFYTDVKRAWRKNK